MKKLIATFMTGMMITVVGVGQSNSNSPTPEELFDHGAKKNTSSNPLGQLKAREDFLKSNRQAKKIQWYEEPRGFLVHYTKDGNKGRSLYDKRGRFVWSILSYDEKSLPRDVINLVKSVYYLDFRITHANEIKYALEPGEVIYLIQLTNGKIWKKVRIMGNEMEVVEEFPAL